MPELNRNLGKLVAVYELAPEHIQRAAFITALSFLFFLAMMFVFYIRQNILYFLLASAFLVIYLVTLFSWVKQRRSVVKVHEHGLNYKGRSTLWSEIESVDDSGSINIRSEKPIILLRTLYKFELLLDAIRQRV